MEIESAIALIGQIVYKPGWHFIAEPHNHRYEGCIKVTVHYPAFNSNRDQVNRENPDASYGEHIETYAAVPILAGECNDEMMLYRRLVDFLAKIEEHETREFFRVQPTGWAPFHPHKPGGMRAWKESGKKCLAQDELAPDLQFGVV